MLSGGNPSLEAVSYSILIGKLMLNALVAVLLAWLFHIQVLLKTDAKYYSGGLPLVVFSYFILIES